MNILISSYAFAPSVGGIETVSAILAKEWKRCGHEVEIVTETPGEPEWDGVRVHRRLGPLALHKKVRSADYYLQNHISLRLLLPALGSGTPTAILHQTYLWHWDVRAGLRGRLKQLIIRRFQNFAISLAVAKGLPKNTSIIGNPYDAGTFLCTSDRNYEREIIFVGRLVSDKGVGLLLDALKQLRDGAGSQSPRLTIVGAGPEEKVLRTQAKGLNVAFVGALHGEALAHALNRHKILVVPSLWPEPFGIVALEGAACGCFIIGSDQGGLPEAIGPCGVTFPNGDLAVLVECLDKALSGSISADQNAVREHLVYHAPEAFARRILGLDRS